MTWRLALLSTLLVFASTANAETLIGRVVGVADGDTIATKLGCRLSIP
jgi:hypothetical protein